MSLNDLKLVDMYLGQSDGRLFCDVKVLPGADAPRQALPLEYADEAERLRAKCLERYRQGGSSEFSLVHDDIRYRVTSFDMPGDSAPFFTVSRVSAQVFELRKLYLPPDIETLLLDPSLRGLVLVCGSMSSGKTSSVQSFVCGRMRENGGIAIAIEDPIENVIEGMHGDGRVIQVEVNRHKGGYEEELTKALRARIGTVLVGEIRDKATASRVLTLANTDHLVFSTIHAASPAAAIELFYTYASEAGVSNAASLVARGLSVVIWQQITRFNGKTKFYAEAASIIDPLDSPTLRTLISACDFDKLPEQFARQYKRQLAN